MLNVVISTKEAPTLTAAGACVLSCRKVLPAAAGCWVVAVVAAGVVEGGCFILAACLPVGAPGCDLPLDAGVSTSCERVIESDCVSVVRVIESDESGESGRVCVIK